MRSIGTSTDDLNQAPKKQKSKIPRLVNNNHVYSKFSRSSTTKSQERALTSSEFLVSISSCMGFFCKNLNLKILLSGKPLKRSPSLGFIPVGNDYVSLIDFPTKANDCDRGWPFVIDKTL